MFNVQPLRGFSSVSCIFYIHSFWITLYSKLTPVFSRRGAHLWCNYVSMFLLVEVQLSSNGYLGLSVSVSESCIFSPPEFSLCVFILSLIFFILKSFSFDLPFFSLNYYLSLSYKLVFVIFPWMTLVICNLTICTITSVRCYEEIRVCFILQCKQVRAFGISRFS